MIITAFNPKTTNLEKTYLDSYHPEAVGELSVKNTNGFVTSRPILIGAMGSERSEVIVVDGVTPNNLLSLDGTTGFAHNAEDPVYKLRWNKIRFYRATSKDGTYTLLDTVDIDVDNEEYVTRYDDTGWVSSYYYKVSYYNSVSTEESAKSDPIAAAGYEQKTIGKVIDTVVRRVSDTNYEILGVDEYLDIAQEVNDDLLLQSSTGYRFMKKVVELNTVAGQNYIDLTELVPNFHKFNYLEYTRTIGGVTNTYKIEEPLSAEAFKRKYSSMQWNDSDDLMDVAIDEDTNRLLLGPGSKTSNVGVIKLHFWATLDDITSLGDIVQTPTTLIYRYKMLAEFYSAKAETDKQWLNLSGKYEGKYGNEIVKLQRYNRADAGTPRSFAPKKVPGMRKRYVL